MLIRCPAVKPFLSCPLMIALLLTTASCGVDKALGIKQNHSKTLELTLHSGEEELEDEWGYVRTATIRNTSTSDVSGVRLTVDHELDSDGIARITVTPSGSMTLKEGAQQRYTVQVVCRAVGALTTGDDDVPELVAEGSGAADEKENFAIDCATPPPITPTLELVENSNETGQYPKLATVDITLGYESRRSGTHDRDLEFSLTVDNDLVKVRSSEGTFEAAEDGGPAVIAIPEGQTTATVNLAYLCTLPANDVNIALTASLTDGSDPGQVMDGSDPGQAAARETWVASCRGGGNVCFAKAAYLQGVEVDTPEWEVESASRVRESCGTGGPLNNGGDDAITWPRPDGGGDAGTIVGERAEFRRGRPTVLLVSMRHNYFSEPSAVRLSQPRYRSAEAGPPIELVVDPPVTRALNIPNPLPAAGPERDRAVACSGAMMSGAGGVDSSWIPASGDRAKYACSWQTDYVFDLDRDSSSDRPMDVPSDGSLKYRLEAGASSNAIRSRDDSYFVAWLEHQAPEDELEPLRGVIVPLPKDPFAAAGEFATGLGGAEDIEPAVVWPYTEDADRLLPFHVGAEGVGRQWRVWGRKKGGGLPVMGVTLDDGVDCLLSARDRCGGVPAVELTKICAAVEGVDTERDEEGNIVTRGYPSSPEGPIPFNSRCPQPQATTDEEETPDPTPPRLTPSYCVGSGCPSWRPPSCFGVPRNCTMRTFKPTGVSETVDWNRTLEETMRGLVRGHPDEAERGFFIGVVPNRSDLTHCLAAQNGLREIVVAETPGEYAQCAGRLDEAGVASYPFVAHALGHAAFSLQHLPDAECPDQDVECNRFLSSGGAISDDETYPFARGRIGGQVRRGADAPSCPDCLGWDYARKIIVRPQDGAYNDNVNDPTPSLDNDYYDIMSFSGVTTGRTFISQHVYKKALMGGPTVRPSPSQAKGVRVWGGPMRNGRRLGQPQWIGESAPPTEHHEDTWGAWVRGLDADGRPYPWVRSTIHHGCGGAGDSWSAVLPADAEAIIIANPQSAPRVHGLPGGPSR